MIHNSKLLTLDSQLLFLLPLILFPLTFYDGDKETLRAFDIDRTPECSYNSHMKLKRAGIITVGVRDLKNGLTRYLRFVEDGESVMVTSRNRPVAVLNKPDLHGARLPEEKIAALVAEGKLLPAKESGPFKPFKPVRAKGKPVSRLIIEERR